MMGKYCMFHIWKILGRYSNTVYLILGTYLEDTQKILSGKKCCGSVYSKMSDLTMKEVGIGFYKPEIPIGENAFTLLHNINASPM